MTIYIDTFISSYFVIKMEVEVRKPTEKEVEEAKKWPIWEKEPSTFPWEYYEPETCLIIEGKAVVKTDEGEVEFGAGDYVKFPKGLSCVWEVKEKIRKYYKLG